MLKKIPISATPIKIIDILSSAKNIFKKEIPREFVKNFSSYINAKYVFFLNSGLSSFYIILEALKTISGKTEVVLPAYTAASLVLAIQKAGLKTVPCDISLTDFNMDSKSLDSAISKNTLCVLGTHLFGIIDRNLIDLKKRYPDVFIIEDCAQSLGSKIGGRNTGSLGDISFFSFNRGKNIPTYAGGCIATNSKDLADKIAGQDKIFSRGCGVFERFIILIKLLAFAVAVRPHVYGFFYPLIANFKDITVAKDFEVKKYTSFQADLGISLLGKIDTISNRRYQVGMRLLNGLRGLKGVIIPEIPGNTQPAFNRFPIVLKDDKRIVEMERALWRAGIETSRQYVKPLHRFFDLGYNTDRFPNAEYFAGHLLALPSHILISDADLDRAVEVIKKIAG